MGEDVLGRLAEVIRARRSTTAATSYTRMLLDGGPKACAKKFGEEAFELALAAVAEDDAAVKAEAADVLYHLLVLLEARGIDFADVLRVLEDRTGTSGLAEKAGRGGQKP